MTKFEKPESRDWQYWDMVKEAGGAALTDAGIAYGDVQQVPRRLLLPGLHGRPTRRLRTGVDGRPRLQTSTTTARPAPPP